MIERRAGGDGTVLLDDGGGELTEAGLAALRHEFSRTLGQRSLVLCLGRNSIGCIGGYLALALSGSVPLLLDEMTPAARIQSLADQYRPSHAWMPLEHELAGVGREVFRYGGYLLLALDAPSVEMHPDLALLLPTSGSTGSPKLVRLSSTNVRSNAEAIAKYLELDETQRPITSLPFHYSFGMSVVHSHYVAGGTVLVTSASMMQKQFWSFLRDAKATSISGVPHTYELLKRLRLFGMDLPSLKTLTQAGGALRESLVVEFANFCQATGRRFIAMYGQTEASPRMAYLPPAEVLRKPASIGVAIPGGRFTILGVDGTEIAQPREPGELVYRGPNVSLGYAHSAHDLALGDERRGVLETGDIAWRDEDGFYYISGRKARFTKVNGHRIGLDEVERLAAEVGVECACMGGDNEVVVYLTDEAGQAPLLKHLADTTSIDTRAVRFRRVAELPRTTTGKIAYSQLDATTP